MWKCVAIGLMLGCFSDAALAASVSRVFRPISFVCASDPGGTAMKVEENVLGQTRSYKVSYIAGEATLFVISTARVGHRPRRIALIDLRSETHPEQIEAARYISSELASDAERYCSSKPQQRLAHRAELLADHEFNRAYPRYGR